MNPAARRHRYAPVGRCIYCGTTKPPALAKRFGDEHIVPLALNGGLILPQASCRRCERVINREIEAPLLTGNWAYFRAKHRLPTRRPRRRKKSMVLHGSRIRIPITEYTAPTLVYQFAPAGVLSGAEPVPNSHAWTVRHVVSNGDEETALQRRYSSWGGRHLIGPVEPYRFARLIAKIAYGFAVAEIGLGCFRSTVGGIILGRSEDYFRLVGSPSREPASPKDGKHHFDIQLRVGISSWLITVSIKLFAGAGFPAYHAVVGEIDTRNPDHAAALRRHHDAGQLGMLPNAVAGDVEPIWGGRRGRLGALA